MVSPSLGLLRSSALTEPRSRRRVRVGDGDGGEEFLGVGVVGGVDDGGAK